MMNKKANLFELILVVFTVLLCSASLFVFYSQYNKNSSYFITLPAEVINTYNLHESFEMQQDLAARIALGRTFEDFFQGDVNLGTMNEKFKEKYKENFLSQMAQFREYLIDSGAENLDSLKQILNTDEKKRDFASKFYNVSFNGEKIIINSSKLIKRKSLASVERQIQFRYYFALKKEINLKDEGFESLNLVAENLARCVEGREPSGIEGEETGIQECLSGLNERFDVSVRVEGEKFKIILETKKEVITQGIVNLKKIKLVFSLT